MKLDSYEPLNAFVISAYWYEEGQEKEEYWEDEQNLYFQYLIQDENSDTYVETRKYWIILQK